MEYLHNISGAHLWQLQGHKSLISSEFSPQSPSLAHVLQSSCRSSHSPQLKYILLTSLMSWYTGKNLLATLRQYVGELLKVIALQVLWNATDGSTARASVRNYGAWDNDDWRTATDATPVMNNRT